ncbi:reverse transcriptase domain-containing protein [Tanacetum coccineum]
MCLFEARQPVIKQYLKKIKEVLESFNTYTMKYVCRNKNKKADALSKLASMTLAHLTKEMMPIREYLLFGLLQKDPQKARKIRAKAPQYKNAKARHDLGNFRMALLSMGYRYCGTPANSSRKNEIISHGNRLLHKMGIRKTFGIHKQEDIWRNLSGSTSYVDSESRKSSSMITESNLSKVEVIDRDIVKGTEKILGRSHQGWVDELPQAVVPIEISFKTRRIKEFEARLNDKRLGENLDILEERREIVYIREA